MRRSCLPPKDILSQMSREEREKLAEKLLPIEPFTFCGGITTWEREIRLRLGVSVSPRSIARWPTTRFSSYLPAIEIPNMEIELPLLLPKIINWAQKQSDIIESSGIALDEELIDLARQVGVLQPERIRVLVVRELPFPDDIALANAALKYELLGSGTVGLTLGYSIFVQRSFVDSTWVLSHEFRHVYQFERAGSLSSFLEKYFKELATYGYPDAPYEIDARLHEIDRENGCADHFIRLFWANS